MYFTIRVDSLGGGYVLYQDAMNDEIHATPPFPTTLLYITRSGFL